MGAIFSLPLPILEAKLPVLYNKCIPPANRTQNRLIKAILSKNMLQQSPTSIMTIQYDGYRSCYSLKKHKVKNLSFK